MTALERENRERTKAHNVLVKQHDNLAKLVGKESELRVISETGVHKLKVVFMSIDVRLRLLERPWWKKLLRRPALEGALFKLVPIVDDDQVKDGEEVVPRPDEIEEPVRGHHVLDIQSGVIGVSDTNPPEEEPS